MYKIIIFLTVFSCMINTANAELRIDVTGAKSEPMPIAIPDFILSNQDVNDTAKNITKVISDDLKNSGLFEILNQNGFIQKFSSIEQRPNFNDWQAINAQALIQGAVENLKDGKIKVSFRLWDVFASSQMEGKVMTTKSDNWRRIAHIIADAVYKRITGENGYFDTRIVYIAETGKQTKKIKRLAVMDQDGENIRILTDGQDMILTPRFSPNMQKITYLSYYKNNPKVYIFDMETGKQELIGNFPGMTFAPRFSPDGKSVIMSMALNGNSDVYLMNLTTKKKQRLTNHPAIDTSPSFSPDGKQITF